MPFNEVINGKLKEEKYGKKRMITKDRETEMTEKKDIRGQT